jgi:RNA polymerase sigma factor (TIGR02999 family)
MSGVTQILQQIEAGDPSAAGQLLPLVYDELRRLAAQKLMLERPGQTLQATALVHEAFLRLVDAESAQRWDNRRHFFAAAAEAMRRILIESARRKSRVRHGGDRERVDLDFDLADESRSAELLCVDEALDAFSRTDPTAAELVKLHFFAGLTLEQAADVVGVSARAAYRDWAYARAWLFRKFQED